MELDAETIFALSCQSSWDRWEFAVVIQTMLHERRKLVRENVREHRKWHMVQKREKEREYHAAHKEQRNAAKRAREKAARDAAIAAGQPTPEQVKWARRKARLRSVRDDVAAGVASLPNRGLVQSTK